MINQPLLKNQNPKKKKKYALQANNQKKDIHPNSFNDLAQSIKT